MKSLMKITLALMAASFLSASPLLAADITIPAQKPDVSSALKDKAASAVESGKTKVDNAADNLKKSLGADKSGQVLDVNQETVTVETPTGAAQETTTVITPETPAPTPPAK